MGDTFTDSWADEVPETFDKWVFNCVENTKWQGNYYRFALLNGDAGEIVLHSVNNQKMELQGEIRFRYKGFSFDLYSFGGEWKEPYDRNSENNEWIPAVKYESIESALTALDGKYDQISENFKPEVDKLLLDKKWEINE